VSPAEPLFAVESRVLPGESAELAVAFEAPPAAGRYVLMLDVLTPSHGSLVERGVGPGLVLFDVAPAPLPDPSPDFS
jgi:hypothetical protein